jgi:hypothetical protein
MVAFDTEDQARASVLRDLLSGAGRIDPTR